MTAPRQMHLGLLMEPTGTHIASWLDPRSYPPAAFDIDYWLRMARQAEAAKFDLIFEADNPGMPITHLLARSRRAFRLSKFEPMTLLAAQATATSHIGLGGTLSTTFNEPYNVARVLASLDLVSRGRAAWNIVTSADNNAARNFGMASMPAHADRYRRAAEFVDVVKKLWTSYEDDAFILDREQAMFVDPGKFHIVDHKGAHFNVHGALPSARSPQGHPVLIQAGSSGAGRELAAEHAEVVFGSADTLEKAQALYKDIKSRMAAYGRTPDQLKLLPGLSMVIADSAAQAEDEYQALQARIHPDVMLQVLSEDLEIDLAGVPLDAPFPVDLLPKKGNLHEAYFEHLSRLIREERPTVRQLFFRWSTRGRNTFRGTPMQVADLMEEFFTQDGADGFMVSFQVMGDYFDRFVREVVPELQRRGLFRTEYRGSTLRDHLGLPFPVHPAASLARDAIRDSV